MVSGTDEHGTPITVAADQEGVTPRSWPTATTRSSARTCAASGSATTCSRARRRATTTRSPRTVFGRCYENGYIFKQTTLGAFSAVTGRTLPDRYVEGTCPICGYAEARGDQCDNCGNQLDPADLINPRSKIDGEPPVFSETEHFFLDLPAFAEQPGASGSASRSTGGRTCARSRSNLLEELQPARDHPRPRLGRADPAAPASDDATTSASTSGSTR